MRMAALPVLPGAASLLQAIKASRIIDLTHRLEAGIPSWPGHPHYCQRLVESYETGGVACHHVLAMGEHSGTHLDAPLHFVPPAAGGWSIAETPVDRFFCRMATLDAAGLPRRGAVPPETLLAWEATYGPLLPGDAVFFHFGWDRFWHDSARHDDFLSDWPGLSAEAAALLAAREVAVVGCDCLSIDCFGSADYPAHRTLLGAGILIGENFNNLGLVPPLCTFAGLPLPIAGGSGAPLRALAIISDKAGQPIRGA
jgi:arylformamidase